MDVTSLIGPNFKRTVLLLIILDFTATAFSQKNNGDVSFPFPLEKAVQYALTHSPLIKKSEADEEITELSIKSKLADKYPQINLAYNFQNNTQLQSSFIQGNVVKTGANFLSYTQLNATQNLFNKDAFLAGYSSAQVKGLAKENTNALKTGLAVSVSKAFYEIITTQLQIEIGQEDIERLERSLLDAKNRLEAGTADKIDYKRAAILLNNAKSSNYRNRELLNFRKEYLKTLMGYPSGKQFEIQYEASQLERQALLDTSSKPDVTIRPEYKVLSMQKKIQEASIAYSHWAYYPNVFLYGNYNFYFLNNNLSSLYQKNNPYSNLGITASLPLFQAGKRIFNSKQESLKLQKADLDMANLSLSVTGEYAQAMAAYKSNLMNYQILKENSATAREVYDILRDQYKAGIKTYLDVITAETDLQSARINYYNALYLLLSSKIDVQKALGTINY